MLWDAVPDSTCWKKLLHSVERGISAIMKADRPTRQFLTPHVNVVLLLLSKKRG